MARSSALGRIVVDLGVRVGLGAFLLPEERQQSVPIELGRDADCGDGRDQTLNQNATRPRVDISGGVGSKADRVKEQKCSCNHSLQYNFNWLFSQGDSARTSRAVALASVETETLPSSFRDPSGFLFRRGGSLFRQVNNSYAEHYDRLMASGLYDVLVRERLLVPHEEVEVAPKGAAYRTIQPQEIAYVSYPYEWSFSQLKSAALLTLRVQEVALSHGMTLKDASAYNVQFVGGRPVFIDTLSFETLCEEEPWVAYRQFCQHFLGPLALMSKVDVRLRRLFTNYLDGPPLDLVSAMLPRRSRFSYSLLAHLHLHARSQIRHAHSAASEGAAARPRKMTKLLLESLVVSLRKAVSKQELNVDRTEWGNYYDDTNYSDSAMSTKEHLVVDLVQKYAHAQDVLHDFGANTGRFSRLVAPHVGYVLAHDIDELAVDRHFAMLQTSEYRERVLPLVVDLTNPSPAIGWDLLERESFKQRARADVGLALALIHHLAISNNTPLPDIARFFAGVAQKLVIEFVPKEDSQVERLLATRADVFPDYHVAGFESAFSAHFEVRERLPIEGTARVLFYLEKRDP